MKPYLKLSYIAVISLIVKLFGILALLLPAVGILSSVNGVTLAASNPQDTHPPEVSKIAFVSDRDGRSQIYVMNPDGTEVTRLTYTYEENVYPSWSPDGSHIAFASSLGTAFSDQLYSMNADGTGRKSARD